MRASPGKRSRVCRPSVLSSAAAARPPGTSPVSICVHALQAACTPRSSPEMAPSAESRGPVVHAPMLWHVLRARVRSVHAIQLCARGASGLSPTKPPGTHWLWRATHCAGVSPRCRPSSREAVAVHSAEAPPPLRSLEAREGCRAVPHGGNGCAGKPIGADGDQGSARRFWLAQAGVHPAPTLAYSECSQGQGVAC